MADVGEVERYSCELLGCFNWMYTGSPKHALIQKIPFLQSLHSPDANFSLCFNSINPVPSARGHLGVLTVFSTSQPCTGMQDLSQLSFVHAVRLHSSEPTNGSLLNR